MKFNLFLHISFTSFLPIGGVVILCVCLLPACNQEKKQASPQRAIVPTPQQMDKKLPELIKDYVDAAASNSGFINDSIKLLQPEVANFLYQQKQFAAQWSQQENFTKAADSLFHFINSSMLYGLFPSDYHSKQLNEIRTRILADSAAKSDKKDAVLWAQADVLLTDALVQLIKDVKLGRLPKDSITLRKDSVLTNEFYVTIINRIVQSFTVARVLNELEPGIPAYHLLKQCVKKILEEEEFTDYTPVPYPITDSIAYWKALQKRLFEEKLLPSPDSLLDSSVITAAIKKYQAAKNLKADGKAGGETIRSLNLTSKEKFIRLAITLDKFKLLPEQMPAKYLWVNIPSYHMQLWENDSIRLTSKICVGKPLTRTPVLNSAVSELVTYPQWTVPQSIIVKEILPALKKDPGYLAKKGFSLLNAKNEQVDPYFVDWSQFSKGIPYKVVQGSGDANALGIMKFNFPNKYAVYLHDTNQRYLFGQGARAFSHGCVRVQEWEKLARYIIRNDSMQARVNGSRSFTSMDSVFTWLKRKEKHVVPLKNRLPVFIRYFTCEAKNGRIVFYDDIYNEDKKLKEKYFVNKTF